MKKIKTYTNSEKEFSEALKQREPKAERALDRLLTVLIPDVVKDWGSRENEWRKMNQKLISNN